MSEAGEANEANEAENFDKELSLQDLLSGIDFEPVKFEIKEFKGFVFIKPMNAKERDEYEFKSQNDPATKKAIRLFMVQRCCCDKEGKVIFSTPEKVGQVSAPVINRLWEHCLKVNGYMDESGEVIAKN